MAERRKAKDKDKQKIDQSSQPSQLQSLRVLPSSMSQTKYESPTQIIPFPGCSPIQISNRFANLGATVGEARPSFQSALISSHDHFQDIAITNRPVASYQKTSPYMIKSHSHLFVIESKYNSIANPITIAKSYFPPMSHFIPPAPYKNLKYYRDILHETYSITIKPIKDRENPHIILYHSLYIHQIISENEWSSHPYDLKVLQSELQYSYYDYIEAWNPAPEQKPSPVSSHSSLPIEGKSKSELQEIARQLMLQASQMHDDTDASPKSESSTSQPKPSHPQAPAQKLWWSDYPDEQDPYDFSPFNLGDD
ncbi:hypothetical protein L3X38_037673 [Prunus dulcis]|uniref:Uncharacterized protein n=1 Tax=Prunus dulcis TaxID=3755 RepID=A0AAD4V546_PRUDU|nr:hypothetical protein L3X38_037673 [Prunus dulcis]